MTMKTTWSQKHAEMRALLLDRPGSPMDLRRGHIPRPVPRADQVLIRVEACGLNPVDVQTISRGAPEWHWPHIPGLDIAGTVEAVGRRVDGFDVGQRVVVHGDLRLDGGLAEYALADAVASALIPDSVGTTAAAALPCAGMTAYQAVHDRLHVAGGQTILVTGAAGGVGGFAVQLAARTGARVIATAALDQHVRVRALGAHDVIDHHTEDVNARVRDLTGGRGVDGVVDSVSAQSATDKLALLVHGGGIACIAGLADARSLKKFTTAPSIHEVALGAAYSSGDRQSRARLAAILGELLHLLSAGELDPMISRTVTLKEAPAVLRDIAEHRSSGRSIVRL